MNREELIDSLSRDCGPQTIELNVSQSLVGLDSSPLIVTPSNEVDKAIADVVTNVTSTFNNPNVALSFSEIARKHEEKSEGSDPLTTRLIDNTLNEYGPIIETTSEPPETSSITVLQADQPKQNSDETTTSPYCPPPSNTLNYSTADNPATKSQDTGSDLIYTTELVNDSEKDATASELLISNPPKVTSSPPLDSINIVQNPTVTTDNSYHLIHPPTTNNGKIPKKPATIQTTLDHLSLVDLQKKYRSCEEDHKSNNKRMQEIERYLNDMQRSSHGRNIETDPMFRQKKDEQKHCIKVCQELKNDLDAIKAKLFDKFQFKMTAAPPPKQTPPVRQRAKMSTGTICSPREDARDHLKSDPLCKKYLLKYNDSRTWCEQCDLHFDTLSGYCEHLHHREHQRGMRRTQPWRMAKEPVSKKKTFDLLQSICAKIENELKQKFNLATLARTLSTCREDKEDFLKNLNINRAKGEFDEDDPLFKIRGYHYLIPVTGYFCTLCNRTMCDIKSAEQHMKSYEHSMAHAKSVALNPQHETNFRANLDKSYKRQHEPARQRSKTSSTKNPPSTARAPLQQYKKSTSRIVDEHERVVEKFPQRSSLANQGASTKASESSSLVRMKARKRALIEIDSDDDRSKSDETRKRKEKTTTRKEILLPEIVPIGSRTQTAALKRLRTEKSQADHSAQGSSPSPIDTLNDIPIETPTEDFADALIQPPVESPDDVTYIEGDNQDEMPYKENEDEYSLLPGAYGSPFPELTLRLTGNAHLDTLRDERLAQPCRVVLKKINIDDYKHMLLDSETLWSRVFQLQTKKEPSSSSKFKHNSDKKDKTATSESLFNSTGRNVPVNLDEKNKFGVKDEKQKIFLSSPSAGKKENSPKKDKSIGIDVKTSFNTGTFTTKAASENEKLESKESKEADDSDGQGFMNANDVFDIGPEVKDPALDMTFLDEFFCER